MTSTFYEYKKELYMRKMDDKSKNSSLSKSFNDGLLVNTTSFRDVVKNTEKWPKYFSYRGLKSVPWGNDARGRKGSLQKNEKYI